MTYRQAVDAAQPLPVPHLSTLLGLLNAPGAVGIIPTDTVYGLVCRHDDPAAIERIYTLKGRDHDKPLALMAASLDQARENLHPRLSQDQCRLLAQHLPGPLTILIGCDPPGGLHPSLTSGEDVVGLRVPHCQSLLSLLHALGRPLASTSANASGDPAPNDAEQIPESLRASVDFILDAGATPLGRPSTILDLTATPVRVVREGALHGEALDTLIQRLGSGT